MLAILFLFAALIFGDVLCRRFLRFDSLIHRLAASFLTGTLISACLVYILALFFSFSGRPLLCANVVFFPVVICTLYLLVNFTTPLTDAFYGIDSANRPPGDWRVDALWLAVCLFFGWILMSAMLMYKDGMVLFNI